MHDRLKRAFVLMTLICLGLARGAPAVTFGSGANTFDIEFVAVGDPGNAADTIGFPNPAGSVPYPFRMGKFEISEQMINKANALAGLGITKDTRGPNKPATDVTWNEAARFVNWLNTSTGSPPAYKFAIQPGQAGYSANSNIEFWTASDAGYNPNNLYRNSLARYFLPSTNEWHKAAFYDPSSGVYYDYPTGSDSIPDGIDFAGDPNFEAVYPDGGFNSQPNDITNVGVLSPYGTAGQGGNVWELEESGHSQHPFDLYPHYPRGLRGGDWSRTFYSPNDLISWVRSSASPTLAGGWVGFRVASAIEAISLTGDFNDDGSVDAADYVVWRKGFGTTYTQDDYNDWRTNFGATLGSGAAAKPSSRAAVPEPSSILIALAGCIGLAVRRHPPPAPARGCRGSW